MKKNIYGYVAAALLGAAAFGPTPASAQTAPWSVSFDLGGQMALSGDVHEKGMRRHTFSPC